MAENELITVDVSAISGITRAEIDISVATAHKFKRDENAFEAEAKKLATRTEEIALDCVYALKREDRRTKETKFFEGPSIRMAEILAFCWGNNRTGARVVNEGHEFITAQGIFHDLQRNSAVTKEVQRRIVSSSGQRYGVDMIGMTGNAAASIALRNAITRGIPEAMWSVAYEACRSIIIGDVRTLAPRRERAFEALNDMGVDPDSLLKYLELKSINEVSGRHLIRVRGLYTSLRDGEVTVEMVTQRRSDPERTKADISGSLNGGKKAPAEPQDGQDASAGQSQAEGGKAPSQATASKAAPSSARPELDEVQAELWNEVVTSLEGVASVQEVEILKEQFSAAIGTQPKIAEKLLALFDARAEEFKAGSKAASKL